jgi:hypothetical protein
MKKVKSTYEIVTNILDYFNSFFTRLTVHLSHQVGVQLRSVIVQALALLLKMIGLSTNIIQQAPISMLRYIMHIVRI